MSEDHKLIAKIATKLLAARIKAGCRSNDNAYAVQCLDLARVIVRGAVQ